MPVRWPITLPATVTLGGLRITDAAPAALRDQFIRWHRIALLHGALAVPLDRRGRILHLDGRSVRLRLSSSRASRAASRALRRAIRRAFSDGAVAIRGDWSRVRCDARTGAALAMMSILGLMLFFMASAAAIDLIGAPLPLLALAAVAGLMVGVGVIVLALGLAPLWRQANVLRLRADSRGLRLILTGGRRRRIAWTDIRHIAPAALMLRLDSGERIWLPRRQRALTELLWIVSSQRGLRPDPIAALPFWTLLLLVLPALGAVTIWWNASLGLLPPTPPQTILFIALAPATIGLIFAVLMRSVRPRPRCGDIAAGPFAANGP